MVVSEPQRRPLHILQVLRAPIGGLFRHVNDLTQALAARGHQIGIVVDSLTSDALTEQKLSLLRPLAGLGIHHAPMPRTIGLGDLTTPLKIRALAQSLKVDVLHGHGAKGGLNARLGRMGRAKRVALYTPHGGVLNYKVGSPVGAFFRGVDRMLLTQTDAIVFESGFARKTYLNLVAKPECPAPVIHNGLAPAEFAPIEPEPGAADFVYIGEFRSVKGITYLLEALVDVKAPDGRPATLIMAGGGPDFEKTKQQIAQLDLSGRVKLAGVQPARLMLARGRCAVVPSLAESLPYVVLEAASAARPVIATNVGGIAEIFGPTAASLLPAADAPALQRAMQAFMDDPAAADREMQVRLDFICTGFSLEHMVDQIETLYYNVMATR